MSDVTIHIDETLDASTIQSLQHDLSQLNGVEHIDASADHPHLMVVKYDQKAMSSGALLNEFSEHGLHAELIGL